MCKPLTIPLPPLLSHQNSDYSLRLGALERFTVALPGRQLLWLSHKVRTCPLHFPVRARAYHTSPSLIPSSLQSSLLRCPCASPLSCPRSSPLRWIHAQLSPSSVAMQNNHQKEHLYKILVIGDLGVGKTSIIKRYVHHNFSPNYRATIGVDFALKVLNWDQETVRLQLWDIAGTVQLLRMAHMKWVPTQGGICDFDSKFTLFFFSLFFYVSHGRFSKFKRIKEIW